VTILSLTDWLNFSVASIEAEKTFIGLGPRDPHYSGTQVLSHLQTPFIFAILRKPLMIKPMIRL